MIAYRDNDTTDARVRRLTPATCPHCAYDRKFPETFSGGWIYPGNNSPIVPCGMCNPNGTYPRT